MKKGQYSDQQILAILQQAERAEKTITELCQEHNLTENTFYRWRKRFAGAAPADLVKNREIEKMAPLDDKEGLPLTEKLLLYGGVIQLAGAVHAKRGRSGYAFFDERADVQANGVAS